MTAPVRLQSPARCPLCGKLLGIRKADAAHLDCSAVTETVCRCGERIEIPADPRKPARVSPAA
jgi:hypothetical protein